MTQLDESTLLQLYHSAVKAFPETAFRQHATDTIVIKKLDWIPFKGMKTLFVKGFAQNEGKEYETIILIKKVNYLNEENQGVRLRASDGLYYNFDKITEQQNVLVRCNCPDFRWRFSYYNHLETSLFGNKHKAYTSKGKREVANPMQLEGMCKHLMKTVKALSVAGIFAQKPMLSHSTRPD